MCNPRQDRRTREPLISSQILSKAVCTLPAVCLVEVLSGNDLEVKLQPLHRIITLKTSFAVVV